MNFITSGFKILPRYSRKNLVASLVMGFMLTIMAGVASSQSNNPVLATDYPERYVVVKGDTLWHISRRFLRDPWRWPEVWQGNPQVDNPDLIYPGDVLVLTFINGQPVLRKLGHGGRSKLSPEIRKNAFLNAIPAIDPRAIQAYLRAPLVTDEDELSTAPYIVDGFDNRLLLGQYSQFYARGFDKVAEDGTIIKHEFAKEYNIFRPGRRFIDPVSGEHLGWEAKDLGSSNFLKAGDPARLVITEGHQDITIRDRLRPILIKEALPFFHPHAPSNDSVRGAILETENRSTELGALSIVAISLGEREGIDAGTVLRINSKAKLKEDPVTGEKYSIPEEPVGLAMVFRTFEKVSYAIVTNSERQIESGDAIVSPNVK